MELLLGEKNGIGRMGLGFKKWVLEGSWIKRRRWEEDLDMKRESIVISESNRQGEALYKGEMSGRTGRFSFFDDNNKIQY